MDQESLQAFILFLTSPEKHTMLVIWGAVALSLIMGIKWFFQGNHIFAWPTLAGAAAMASVMLGRQDLMEWVMPVCLIGFVVAVIRGSRQPGQAE